MASLGRRLTAVLVVQVPTRRASAALSGGLLRTYYSRPVPVLPLAQIQRSLWGNKVALGSPLNQHEVKANTAAHHDGFLLMRNGCGEPLTTQYLRYCMGRRRPYIAISRDGASVTVDLRPVLGPARIAADRDVDRVLGAFQAVLADPAWGPGTLQLVLDDTLKEQIGKVVAGPLEGSNDGRPVDRRLEDSFSLLTTGRAASLRVAAALFSAFIRVTGAPTPEDLKAAKHARYLAKTAAKRRLLIRRLTRLAADPIAARGLRVKAGVLDGFIRASSVGPVA